MALEFLFGMWVTVSPNCTGKLVKFLQCSLLGKVVDFDQQQLEHVYKVQLICHKDVPAEREIIGWLPANCLTRADNE